MDLTFHTEHGVAVNLSGAWKRLREHLEPNQGFQNPVSNTVTLVGMLWTAFHMGLIRLPRMFNLTRNPVAGSPHLRADPCVNFATMAVWSISSEATPIALPEEESQGDLESLPEPPEIGEGRTDDPKVDILQQPAVQQPAAATHHRAASGRKKRCMAAPKSPRIATLIRMTKLPVRRGALVEPRAHARAGRSKFPARQVSGTTRFYTP